MLLWLVGLALGAILIVLLLHIKLSLVVADLEADVKTIAIDANSAATAAKGALAKLIGSNSSATTAASKSSVGS